MHIFTVNYQYDYSKVTKEIPKLEISQIISKCSIWPKVKPNKLVGSIVFGWKT